LEVLPFSLAHNVVSKDHALKDCVSCHSESSILFEPVEVFDFKTNDTHMEVSPVVDVLPEGDAVFVKDGTVYYDSRAYLHGFYVMGASRTGFIEILGWFSVLGAFLGIIAHASLRVRASVKRSGKGDNEEEGETDES